MGDNNKKTMVLLCRCGTNIADQVDVDRIAAWARSMPDLYPVEIHELLCSPDGKQHMAALLADEKPDSVVIAACSPKMHEKTFQEVAEEAGVNMGRVHIANVREQCAWVTRDPDEATRKARALIQAAVRRSRQAVDLEKRSMNVNTDLLVIGGGIAGIEAALAAARAGRKVWIVEREISLGGAAIKTEELAPGMECAPCLLAPRLAAVKDSPDITVVTSAEVTDVIGFYGNFTVRIMQKARYVEDSCIGCESCFEVCPVSVPHDFQMKMGTRKAVYTLFPGSVPASAAIDGASCRHFSGAACDACKAQCPFGSINFDQQDEEIEIQVGAIIVATGFSPADPSSIVELGYGRIANVYTLAEFERMASSNGPFGGGIQLQNGSKPASVAVIHCAGSMRSDAKGLPYCSGVCCMEAVKVGELVRAKIPDAAVVNIHNDMVFPGPGDFRFYQRQKSQGTRFLKTANLSSVRISGQGGAITVRAAGVVPFEVDMVVLATGLQPASGTAGLADMLHVDLTPEGFFKPDHELLHATGASLDGIYVAGCAGGPCSLSAAVTRGQAAVGDALSKLVPGRQIKLEVMTAVIDADKCGGCKLCITVCPYKAVTYDAETHVSRINEAICRGCGTCAASCPSGAAAAKHFTDDQMYAEIEGLFDE